jgi:ribosomal protein S18 acetylase RimI-like enzyme
MAMWRREPEPLEDQVEILDLRHFSSADVRSLLEQETAVWSRMLAWDYRSSADMVLRYLDAKILPGYAAVQQGEIFGYSFFVYEGSKGVIGDLFVGEPSPRVSFSRHEVAETLVKHVIETLQQSPGVRRVEAQLLAHETGAVARPFLERRFRRYPRIFMVLDLSLPSSTRRVSLPADIELRRWSELDYQSVAALITAAYRNHVDSEINDQYRSVNGALRFLNNIVRFPGCGQFDPDSSFVAARRRSNAIIGAILCSRVKDDVGHVTQVCLLPDERGHGVGEALLNATANELTRRRFSKLTLTVTEANAGAVRLYKRLGYSVGRVFDAFVWEG